MFLEPLTCAECCSIRTLPAYTSSYASYYCGLAPTDKRFEICDINTFKVNPDEQRPDWCPIIELNKQLAALPEEKQQILSSFMNIMEIIFKMNMEKDKYDLNGR